MPFNLIYKRKVQFRPGLLLDNVQFPGHKIAAVHFRDISDALGGVEQKRIGESLARSHGPSPLKGLQLSFSPSVVRAALEWINPNDGVCVHPSCLDGVFIDGLQHALRQVRHRWLLLANVGNQLFRLLMGYPGGAVPVVCGERFKCRAIGLLFDGLRFRNGREA